MNFFRAILNIFKNYTYKDKLVSGFMLVAILAMFVKMMLFPYGLFGFGESNIYTEGIVSQNGIQSINPLFVDYNEADREISSLVFSGLMKYDPLKRAIKDDMAVLSINEDKTKYTFTLREGLKWHDGQALTADDVYFTFHELVMSESFPNDILKTNFAGVLIEQTDNRTVVFTLEKPNIFFVNNLTIGIVPKHILKNTDPFDLLQSSFNKNPVGSGPYMITEPVEIFQNGRMQVTLTRSPYYYGETSEVEMMRFIVYPTMEELLKEIDVVNGVVKVSGKYIADFATNERFKLFSYELPQYTGVFMNMESEILKNQKVRLALQKAIDKEELLKDTVDQIRVDTPLMELDQKEWVYKPSKDEAQGALKEAGYSYKEDDQEKAGFRFDEEGNALELNFVAILYEEGSYKFEETTKIVSFLQNAWEEIGVDIKVEFLPPGTFEERVAQRQYDLLLLGQTLGYNLDTYSYWHSSQASPMGLDLSNYKSFQVDTLIETIRSTFDPAKREEKLRELAEKIREDIPAIFLYRPVYYYASDGKVSGIDLTGVAFPSDRFANIALWKFER